MSRIYNFSAGPSMLPEKVLQKAASEMLDYNGTGISIMEMSHRTKVYEAVVDNADKLLRKLMNIPDNYTVMFLQGGASQQFAMIPMNIMTNNKKADFINTGTWSKKAMAEAKLFGTVNVIASSEDKNFSYIPENYTISQDADFVHITTNNTIEGTKFSEFPNTGNVPLVADMSSNILSEEIDVSKFGIIYAGAQKNLGPAGVTIVVIRNDLLGKHLEKTPFFFRYETHAKEKSMYNTPPSYSIYVVGLVLEWLQELGGVKAMQEINKEKAGILYNFIEESEMFKSPVNKRDRSLMNIPFTAPNDELNEKFITLSESLGFGALRGHRLIGGMRASIYNAMPVEGVKKLVELMKKFEMENK